ncbi:MAG: hypothetical protein Q7U78_02320 [Gallionella sp.]|nr:hypothetical protein [Gallionella sp.]
MNNAVNLPVSPIREIRLWWPMPLAAILWLLIIASLGYLPNPPETGATTSLPIEASFVELPDASPAGRPEAQPKRLPDENKSGVKPHHAAPPRAPLTESRPEEPEIPAIAEPTSDMAPPTDMMSYVNAARARHRAAETAAARENAEATARQRGPSADEIRTANIMRNLQPQGTNGVFQIISMDTRTARFSFRGWTKDFSNARREVIEVDAGQDGDVERAMVRSMIVLIRKYYQGYFNWESQHLARVVVLSARLEDNTGLEDFLIREFFGAHAASYGGTSRNETR